MKLGKEELTQIVQDAATEQVKALYPQLTEDIKEQIKGAVQDVINDKTGLKKLIGEGDEHEKGTDPKAGFMNFAEFALAVKDADISHRQIYDKRLSNLKTKAMDSTNSVNETDAEVGGYLIPEEFRNQLLEFAVQKSGILNLAMAIPMATNAVNIPYIHGMDRSGGTVHGGIEFKWLDEEAQKTESRPRFGKIQLRLKKVAGLVFASDELLEDSPVTLEPLLTRMFSDALAWQLDEVFINGSGAGRPLGILNAPCLITVDKETGQRADTLLFENIIKMYARMWDKSNAQWFVNDNTFTQLATLSLAVGTGGIPVWMPAGGASGKPYDTLMGKPMLWTEHMKKLGDKGDIAFCDWSQYLVGQKSGGTMQFASSIHLRFDYDQTAFRFVFRIDGQPWWPTAATPLYATSDTLSPFVTLAERA